MTTYTYKTTPGCAIQADVHTPAGAGPRPVIVWLHGGALIAGGRDGMQARHREAYLEAGYAVVAGDYRLAPETKLPEIIADLRDLLDWIRAEGPKLFGADPTRVAVIGHSAGGYLTLMAGVVAAPPLQALVAFYGYGDIIGDWYRRPDPFYCQQPMVPEAVARAGVGTTPLANGGWEGRGDFYLYCRQHGLWPKEVAGFDPDTQPEAFTPYCPVQSVTPDYPPTLLLHGDQDTDVPYAQSVQMAEALTRAGVPHELITIAGGAHGFDYEEGEVSAQAFARVLAFLRERIGGQSR